MKRLLLLLFIALPTFAFADNEVVNRTNDYHYRRASQFEVLQIHRKDVVFIGDGIIDGGEWAELFNNRRIKNRGVIGDMSCDVLDRLCLILKGEPKKVFLMVGINDLNAGRKPEQVAKNIAKIIELFKKESPRTQLYIHSVLPINDQFRCDERIELENDEIIKTNQLIQIECIEHDVIYLDLHTLLAGKNGKLKPEYSGDGMHLVGEGYVVWRDAIRKYVR